VPLRAQPSEQADFIESALPSGTAVTLIDASPVDGFVLIRLTDGTEGYILNQYLVGQPIARDRIKILETELEQSILHQASQRSELNKTAQLAAEYLEQVKLLSTENNQLNTEFERLSNLSQGALKKEQDMAALRRQLETTTGQLTQIQSAEQERDTELQQRWFLIGASAILFGLLIGFWMARKLYQGRFRGGWS
jgi:SH3 domain protein